MPSHSQHILILGGGFGGVHAFLDLQKRFKNNKNIHITLVSNTSYFLFTPFLHEIATARITPEDVTEPLRTLIKHPNAKIKEAQIQKISVQNKSVTTSKGELHYDFLVVALGSTTNFYGIAGAEKNCFTLKSVDEALQIKKHFFDLVRTTNFSDSEKKLKAHFTISLIGGGASGVELAAEISDLFYKVLKNYFPQKNPRNYLRILLIEQSQTILPGFSKNIQQKTLRVLRKKRVDVLCTTSVTKIEKNKIHTQTGVVETATAIWTAGIKPNAVQFDEANHDSKGCLLVEHTLELCGTKNIFVIGDSALCLDVKTQKPVPHLAQSAVQQADLAADNIYRMINGKPLQTYSYFSRGEFISLGEHMALGNISRFSFHGKLGSSLWHIIHISKMLSWKKRITVARHWLFHSRPPAI